MYRIYDRNDNLVAESQDRDEAIKEAKDQRPNETLVVEHIDDRGRRSAFIIGAAPISLG